jgi:hypothetical protein
MKKLLLTTFIISLLSPLTSLFSRAQDFDTGLVRLKSKRTSWYLSTESSGSAATTAKNTTKLNQAWILEVYGDGYYLRNANTGEYLQADYTQPGTGKLASPAFRLFGNPCMFH